MSKHAAVIINERYQRAAQAMQTPSIDVDQLAEYLAYDGQRTAAPADWSIFDGAKFPGGWDTTYQSQTDYWTLRARSSELFKTNLYAYGLIKRLTTNEINTGLMPESTPEPSLLGLTEDQAADLSDEIETYFEIWASMPEACDWAQRLTFGAKQSEARTEAIIEGDALVVLRQSPTRRTPSIQIVPGSKVLTPMDARDIPDSREIIDGVEVEKSTGRHVAFHIQQEDGSFRRLPATGPRSGRRIAYMVYGLEKRTDEVRGRPLLSILMQSLRELDRYRDSATRKAVINSLIAMFVKKGEDKPSSLPLTGSAAARTTGTATSDTGERRSFKMEDMLPGSVIEELQHGEEPVAMNSNGTDTSFPAFEEAIIAAIAWSQEIPPEILKLAFSNNYSASQAAINEFKSYLRKFWSQWGAQFCQPVYREWVMAEALRGASWANGFLDVARDPTRYMELGAWVKADWHGTVKPSTDIVKQARGSKMLTDEGWSTNAKESRELSGTKFSRNARALKRENQIKADMVTPIIEMRERAQQAGMSSAQVASLEDRVMEAVENVES